LIEFEWDESKRETNLKKHGIDFSLARILFYGRPVVSTQIPDQNEHRVKTTGKIRGKYWTAIWTQRDGAIRFISVRRARNEEIGEYRSVHG
jgi:uncharacterized DUF497 family protein